MRVGPRHALLWRRLSDAGQLAAAALPVAQRTAAGCLKVLFHRARPLGLSSGGRLPLALSFPSGHATSAAAGAVYWARHFAHRHPSSPWRPAVVGTALVLSGATAYGRVACGRHFVSDVVAGLVLGAAMGLAAPLGEADPTVTPGGGGSCRGLI